MKHIHAITLGCLSLACSPLLLQWLPDHVAATVLRVEEENVPDMGLLIFTTVLLGCVTQCVLLGAAMSYHHWH